MAKPKRKIRNPSVIQVCVPVEVFDAVEHLAEYEGSTVSQISRRAIIGLLVQAGMYRPPQMKVSASQQSAN